MIHVAFDTSALQIKQLRQRNMLILRRLIRMGKLRIHLPDVVYRELLSQQQESAKAHLQTARISIEALTKILGATENQLPKMDIEDTAEKLAALGPEIEDLTTRALDNWINSWAVVIDRVARSDGIEVLDDYFSGKGAFRQPKERKDFPDAFIEKSLTRLLAQHGEIAVLVNDNQLSRALAVKAGVTVFNSVRDFLSTQQITDLIEHDADLSPVCRQVVAWLESGAFLQILQSFLERHEESNYLYLEEGEIYGAEVLDIDLWSVTLEGFDTPIDHLEVRDSVALTERKFSVQFSFISRGNLGYCVDYRDWEELEYSRGITFNSMNGDGVVEVHDDRVELKFIGDAEITILEGFSLDQGHDRLTDEHLQLAVEIEKAEVLGTTYF